MSHWYKLDENNIPVPCDVLEAAIGESNTIKRDDLPDGSWVSTVFLRLDHNFGDGPPILFETMVFGVGSMAELDMNRYVTYDEAIIGHNKMVEKHGGFVVKPITLDEELFKL